jgi:hypothetical protein
LLYKVLSEQELIRSGEENNYAGIRKGGFLF